MMVKIKNTNRNASNNFGEICMVAADFEVMNTLEVD